MLAWRADGAGTKGRAGSYLAAVLGGLAGFLGLELALGAALETRPDLRLAPRSDEGRRYAHYRAHAEEHDRARRRGVARHCARDAHALSSAAFFWTALGVMAGLALLFVPVDARPFIYFQF